MPIPAPERIIAKLLIKRWCRRHPPHTTNALLRQQNNTLRTLITRHHAHATTPIQIKRLPGLEAASTKYSLAMVADHLQRVNHAIAALLEDITNNRSHGGSTEPALYKPEPSAQPDESLANLDGAARVLEPILTNLDAIAASNTTHTHPWFGELPATTWACFPTFHTSIHLKQALLIASDLPSTQ